MFTTENVLVLENGFRTLPFHWMVGNRHETKEMCCFKLLLRSLQHPMFTQLTQSTVLAICYISVGYRAWCLRPRNSENAYAESPGEVHHRTGKIDILSLYSPPVLPCSNIANMVQVSSITCSNYGKAREALNAYQQALLHTINTSN